MKWIENHRTHMSWAASPTFLYAHSVWSSQTPGGQTTCAFQTGAVAPGINIGHIQAQSLRTSFRKECYACCGDDI